MNLAHGIAGKRVENDHALGLLEARQPRLQQLDDLALGNLAAAVQNDCSRDAFAQIRMRHAEDSALGNA